MTQIPPTAPTPPWCSPPASASACGRSPRRCRSLWSQVGGRALIDHRPRPARGGRHRARGRQRAPPRRHGRSASARRARRRHRHLGRARGAAGNRRRREEGAAASRRRRPSSRSIPTRSGSRVRRPNLRRLLAAWDPAQMDILLLAGAARRPASATRARGDFAMDAEGRLRRRGEPGGDALRLCGRRHPEARAVRRHAGRAVLGQPPFSTGPSRRAGSLRLAPRRPVAACRRAPGASPSRGSMPWPRARGDGCDDVPRVFSHPARLPLPADPGGRAAGGRVLDGFPPPTRPPSPTSRSTCRPGAPPARSSRSSPTAAAAGRSSCRASCRSAKPTRPSSS